MATIIKIKNSSTIGNVPSSLERGELAINTRDGNLFYGDGTYVQQDFVFNDLGLKGNLTVDGNLTIDGNITAQQYIVSSSVTYMTQSFSSGSTIFGDSADDTHQFTGSLLVNGNSILDGNFTVEGNTYLNGSNIYLGNSIGDRISVNGTIITQIKTDSHITASGNISSSGDIFANNATIANQLTAAGIAYPTADGDNGDVLITDGAGNLSFTRTTVYAQVKNVSGVDLVKGYPVHVTGTSGNASEIVVASASNAATMPAHFILNEDITNGAEGQAIAIGFINGVSTAGFGEGDTVYVDVDGGYTNVKPTGSNLIQNLGIVTKVHASNGSGFILGAGRSNDVPNISPGYAWVGNSDQVATAVATSSFVVTNANTASYVAADNIAQPFSTFEVNGPSNSHVEVGTHIIGYDSVFGPLFQELQITGSGLIISGAMAAGHHNMLKIGEVELIDLNTNYLGVGNPGEFLIHNVKSFKITSGSDSGDIAQANVAFQHDGDSFYLCKGGEAVANATIKSVGSTTTIQDTDIEINASNGPSFRALNSTTSTHIAGFAADPNSAPRVMQSISVSDMPTLIGAVANSQTSSMSVATASYITGGNVDGAVASATDATNADNINVGNNDGSSTYFVLAALGTGNQAVKRASGFTFNSSTNTLNAGNLDSAGKIFIGDNELRSFNNNFLVYDGGLQAEGNITASGNISASGNITAGTLDAEVHHLELNSASIDTSTNGSAVGDVMYIGNSTTVAGYVYYLNSSGGWTATDADAESSSKGMLAIALGTNSTTDGMLLKGLINPAGTGLTASNIGDPIYLSLVAGRFTGDVSAYTTNDVVRVVGYQVASDCIYFNPDNTYIVLA